MHAENYEVINTENIRPCYHQLLELFSSSSRKDTCIWRILIKLRTLNLTQIHYVSHFPVLQSALLQSALALKHINRDMIERLWKTKHLHYTLFDFKTGQIWKNEKKKTIGTIWAKYFCFLFVIWTMVNTGIFNNLSKLKSQILHYKQDTELEMLYVNKARVLVLLSYVVLVWVSIKLCFFVHNIINEHMISVDII